MTIVREQVRDYGWENVIGRLFGDVRYAAPTAQQSGLCYGERAYFGGGYRRLAQPSSAQ